MNEGATKCSHFSTHLEAKLKSAYSNNMIETGNFENKALCNIYKKFFRRLLNNVTFNQRGT